jgi:hypothetical protein
MIINFSPILWDAPLSMSVAGDTLTINGEPFDFSLLDEGDLLPADAVESDFINSPVTRSGGEIVVTVLLPIPSDASEAQRFPEPVTFESGQVPLPAGVDHD